MSLSLQGSDIYRQRRDNVVVFSSASRVAVEHLWLTQFAFHWLEIPVSQVFRVVSLVAFTPWKAS